MRKDKWRIYLYADILGYKDLLKRNSSLSIKNKIFSVIRDIQELITEELEKDKNRYYILSEPLKQGKLGLYFAFDTIVVYWKDLNLNVTWKEFDGFLDFVSLIYINLLVKHKLLIRGAITITKDYFINNKVF